MDCGNWHILKDNKTKKREIYYYDTPDDFEEEFGEKFSDKKEIKPKDWTAKEIAEVLSDMTEDRNMHSSLYWPELVKSAMEKEEVKEKKQKKIMLVILEEMCTCHL